MIEQNLKSLFLYLSKIDIKIDQNEFSFQIKSHPDFPSLLAISDTLTFFKINNLAFKIANDQIYKLPNQFIGLVNGIGLSYIQKVHDGFNVNEIFYSKEDFNIAFDNIVLLAEKDKSFVSQKQTKSSYFYLALVAIILGLPILLNSFELWSMLFYILSFLGILLSYETFNQSLGLKTSITSKFCSLNLKTSCESVVNSKKWKFLDVIKINDISVIFFGSQLVLISLFSLNSSFIELLDFSVYFIWLSMPIILLSMYFQNFVENKWCPLCLAISTILFIQTVLVYFINNFNLIPIKLEILFYVISVISLVSFFWIYSKGVTIKLIEHKNLLSKALRFKHNYGLFREQLIKSEVLVFPKNDCSILYGNKKAQCHITLVTSPFCGYCKKAHETLHKVYKNHKSKLAIHIYYSMDSEIDKERFLVIKRLQTVFLKYGLNKLEKELGFFYEKGNYLGDFLNKTNDLQTNISVKKLLHEQHQFALKNKLHYTPMLFINGHIYPELYDMEDLEFLINDIVEDTFQ